VERNDIPVLAPYRRNLSLREPWWDFLQVTKWNLNLIGFELSLFYLTEPNSPPTFLSQTPLVQYEYQGTVDTHNHSLSRSRGM